MKWTTVGFGKQSGYSLLAIRFLFRRNRRCWVFRPINGGLIAMSVGLLRRQLIHKIKKWKIYLHIWESLTRFSFVPSGNPLLVCNQIDSPATHR